MTTVGYGDVAITTDFGKIVAITTAFWGTFVLSMFVLVASSVFELTP